MILIIITGFVFGISIFRPNSNNLEIIKLFTTIMEKAITLIGGGWLGANIGEKESLKEKKNDK